VTQVNLGIPDVEDLTLEEARRETFVIAGHEDVLPMVTNQNSGGPTRRLEELISRCKWEVVKFLARTVLPNAYWRTASGAWLEAKGRDCAIDRLLALTVQGEVTFSREDATGTALVPAGGLVRTGYDSQGRQYRYRVVQEVVAGDGQASIKVPVEATETGAAFNVGAGTIVEFATSFPGWDAVTNEPGWITREGRDDEEDGRRLAEGEPIKDNTGLRRRIGLAWTSGNRCNDDAYRLAALNAGARDVVIKHHRGVHTVDVFVTGPTGLASAELIAAVEEKIADP